MPNVWDAGSARILTALGFECLGTSSGASAARLARKDGEISREEAFAHAREIVEATQLPISADLEDGFGESPSLVAETIRMAIDVGLAGASIEDSTGEAGVPLYSLDLSVERIHAAVEAARRSSSPFTITARAENFFRGAPDLDDAIRRLAAYEKGGADVLFAPALPDLDAVRAVCAAVSKPVSFMVGIRGKCFTVAELREAGVKRISFGSSFYRAAMTGFLNAAQEVKQSGRFDYLDTALTTPELNRLLQNTQN